MNRWQIPVAACLPMERKSNIQRIKYLKRYHYTNMHFFLVALAGSLIDSWYFMLILDVCIPALRSNLDATQINKSQVKVWVILQVTRHFMFQTRCSCYTSLYFFDSLFMLTYTSLYVSNSLFKLHITLCFWFAVPVTHHFSFLIHCSCYTSFYVSD